MIKTHTTTELIAKEGWKYVGLFGLFFLFSLYLNFLEWVFLTLFLLTIFIYRNFERIPAEDDKMALLAPADGSVVDISKVIFQDGKEFLKLEIRKNIWNMSILRSPMLANISNVKKIHGLLLSIESPLSKKLGERTIVKLDSEFRPMFMVVTAGMFSIGIELFKSIGPLKFAQRFGLLLDGSVELLLPIDTRIKVSLGDSVRAGESVLGYFAYGAKDDKQ
ncbi:MAG: phosphatidylserine decarboxylase [Sulfurospirillum sp.]